MAFFTKNVVRQRYPYVIKRVREGELKFVTEHWLFGNKWVNYSDLAEHLS